MQKILTNEQILSKSINTFAGQIYTTICWKILKWQIW